MSAQKEKILAELDRQGLSIEATFVPWSQSRNKGDKHRSLNWRVKLMKSGRAIWEGDYSAGEAHCPSYDASSAWRDYSVDQKAVIDRETETGFTCVRGTEGIGRKAIFPDICDVMYSLVSDADAIDHASFESWADDLGYETDSRKAESIYRECLKIGLALRNNADLERLQEAFQDY